MKTKQSHTPTPWKVGMIQEINRGLFRELENGTKPTGILIEEIDDELSDETPIKQHKANAAFIVRAVNCHEELLEALKDIVMHERGECDHDNIEECSKVVLKIAERAIAKAEGK